MAEKTLNSYKETRNYDIGFEAIAMVAETIAASKFMWLDKIIEPDSLLISCRTNASPGSWGEVIEVRIKELAPNRTNVTISSYAIAQEIDWGASGRNVREFFQALDYAILGIIRRNRMPSEDLLHIE